MTYDPVRAAEPQLDPPGEPQLPPRDSEQSPDPVTPLASGEKPTIWRVLKDQRKALWVALVLVVASFWVLGQLDRWALGTSIAIALFFALLLCALALAKATMVAMYFMHLKFDSKLFRRLFVTGIVLAFVVFTIVLLTFFLRPEAAGITG